MSSLLRCDHSSLLFIDCLRLFRYEGSVKLETRDLCWTCPKILDIGSMWRETDNKFNPVAFVQDVTESVAAILQCLKDLTLDLNFL